MARIAFVDNYGGPGLGGGEVVVAALTLGLRQAGWDVHVMGPAAADWLEAVKDAGATVHGTDFRPSSARSTVRHLCGLFSKLEPDVVHAHGFYPGLLARRASPASRPLRVVVAAHCEPDSVYRVSGGPVRFLESKVRATLERMTSGRVAAYVAVSGAVRDALVRQGVPADKVKVIHSGVAIPAAPCPESAPEHSPPVVGAVGRLESVKGFGSLVAAARILADRGSDARFVLHGEGSAEAALLRAIEDAGLAGTFTLAGALRDRDQAFSGMDVCVSSSLSEGLNLSLVDAMMRGVPVVATSVGGQVEVVRGGAAGLLVEPAAPAALADAIEGLLADDALRQRLSTEGCLWAREAFSVDRMVSAHVGLYERLLS